MGSFVGPEKSSERAAQMFGGEVQAARRAAGRAARGGEEDTESGARGLLLVGDLVGLLVGLLEGAFVGAVVMWECGLWLCGLCECGLWLCVATILQAPLRHVPSPPVPSLHRAPSGA